MKKYIKYIVLTIFSIAIMVLVYFSYQENVSVLRFLCDGFFIAGTLILCFGGLIFVTNEGVFDGFTYGVRNIFISKTKKNLSNNIETFYDYRARKHKGKEKDCLPYVFYGLALLLISIVLFIILK